MKKAAEAANLGGNLDIGTDSEQDMDYLFYFFGGITEIAYMILAPVRANFSPAPVGDDVTNLIDNIVVCWECR